MRYAPLLATLIALTTPPALAGTQESRPVGSDRGARVAVDMPADPQQRPELTFVAAGLGDEQLAELKTFAPNVRIVNATSREAAMAAAKEAHGIDGRLISAELVAAAPKLAWVQWPSAGVEGLLRIETLAANERIVLTNMAGVSGPAIADHAFAMLLTLTRNLRVHERNQAAGQWGRGDDVRRGLALEGRTLLVVGLGGIGSEIAKRADGFGMRVIATRRSDAPAPAFVDRVGTPDELHAMLAEADVVAIAVPLTDETRGMFDERAFAAMKPGAYLINVARGAVVNTDAMVAALGSGRLAGACLDVTDPEPLPPGHTLWSMSNVVITPHTSGAADLSQERWWALYKENVRRFGAGEPLLNVVDRKAGY